MGCTNSKDAGVEAQPAVFVDTSWKKEVVPGIQVDDKPKETREDKEADIRMQTKKRPSMRDAGAGNDLSSKGWLFSRVARGVVLHEGTAMTMPFQVQVVAPDSSKRDIVDIVESVMQVTHDVFNNWNPDSELETRINTPDRPDKIAVSEDLAKVLQVSADLVRVTGGRFDPTVMPVMRLWRRLLNDESRPPRQDEIDRYKFAVGWSRNVEMTRKAGGGAIVSLPNTLSRLDLGAVAKGYAIDLIAERFLSRGWSSWVIEWGGDVRANGAHPAGRPWRTCLIAPPDMNPLFACWTKDRLADCLNPKDMVAKINLSGMAAATSGDYFQVHRFGYHHIMHPGHRTPLKVNQEGVASATVVAPTAAAADAVATAAIVAGSVAKSSEFLLALCKAGVIAGFCLLSRSQAPVFHGAMFEPTGGAASANLSAEIDVAKQPSLSRAAPLWASFSDALGQAGEARVAQVSCKGRTTEVSTMATVSMYPLMVSLIVPPSHYAGGFSEGAAVSISVTSGSMKGRIEGTLSSAVEGPGRTGVLVVHVTDVKDHPNGRTPDERLKSILRGQALPICLAAFRSRDTTRYAVTASSVRALEPGCFTFNLQLNSRAGMAMDGMTGTRCALMYLEGRHKALAQHHVSDPLLTDKKFKELSGQKLEATQDGVPIFNAGITCICRITRTVLAGDHVLVVCALEDVKVGASSSGLKPLLYMDKEFVTAD